jgi:hypothetical protein
MKNLRRLPDGRRGSRVAHADHDRPQGSEPTDRATVPNPQCRLSRVKLHELDNALRLTSVE